MPIDRKSLRQKVQEQREQQQAAVKAICYPLPDLRGPGGNAFNLIGEANKLMSEAGISPTMKERFQKEAMSGDYDKVLQTIEDWFTVVVPTPPQYVNISATGNSILDFKPKGEVEESWEEYDENHPSESNDESVKALEDMEEDAERMRKIAEAQKRITAEVQKEFGLDPDDVVIVQIKKAKKS